MAEHVTEFEHRQLIVGVLKDLDRQRKLVEATIVANRRTNPTAAEQEAWLSKVADLTHGIEDLEREYATLLEENLVPSNGEARA